MRLGLGLGFMIGLTVFGGALAAPDESQFIALRAAAFAQSSTLEADAPASVSLDGRNWLSTTRDVLASSSTKSRLDVTTSAERATAGAVLGPLDGETLQTRGYDLTYTRGWPSAFSVETPNRYGFDLSPHAAVGMGDYGRSAEAGAMVRFGRNLQDSVTDRLNIKDGSSLGAQSRWYVYAAASGRAVGMNLTNSDGDWRRAGLTQDNANALVGDAQAGVGWRKGPMAATVGYIRRDIKIRSGLEGLMGAGDRGDNLLALAFSIKPQR